MALEQETALFDAQRAKWVEEGQDGKFVAIVGENVVGFFDDLNSAIVAGGSAAAGGDFLAQEVTLEDRVDRVQRIMW